MLEGFLAIPLAVEVRFGRWNEILKRPAPDPSLKIVTTFWHYARGMALASTGKLTEAEAEYKVLDETAKATPEDAIFAPPFNNKTKNIVKIARNVLGARIGIGHKDTDGAIAMLREAVAVQDSLNYGEPPDWYFPVREALGAALLVKGDATAAEQVFREDLDRNPRNPRSLFGLQQALQAQGRNYDARFVEKQFQSSWKGGNGQLKVEDLV